MTPFPNRWPVPKQNLYSPNEIHTSYGLFTSDRIRLIPRTNDSPNEWLTFPYLSTKTSYRTDYISYAGMDDLFPDRIYILSTNGWPSFRTDDLFPNRLSILSSKYISHNRGTKVHFLHTVELKLGNKLSPFLNNMWCIRCVFTFFLSSFCTVAHNIVSYLYNWGTTFPPILYVHWYQF